MKELIRTWAASGFKLAMYDTHKRDRRGQTNIAYKLWDNGKLIFDDSDFSCSPMYANDSDESVSCLLGFLSLKDGDIDDEYFARYTPAQIAWRDERAEELALEVLWMEEVQEKARERKRNRGNG